MALDAGVMSVTIEYAKDLKDKDWFGKQDPYCIVRVGGQTFRTRTAVDGGRNPVWSETFRFNIINENDLEIDIKDEDVLSRDDLIGCAALSLARAREAGSDRISAPVISRKSRKQRGFLCVALSWAPNAAVKQGAAGAAGAMPAHAPHYAHPAAPYHPPYHCMAPPPPAPAGYYPAVPMYYATAPPPAYAMHYPPAHATPGGAPPAQPAVAVPQH